MPVGRVSGKTALVTGGASGIGAAIASALSGEGANVVIADLNKTAGKRFASSLTNAVFTHHDVTSETDWEACMAETRHRFGSLEILVNNAGVTRDALLLRMNEEQWDTVLDTNLKGSFHGMKAAIRPMMKKKSGRIINITSIVGLTGNSGQANYAASKSGLIGMSKSIAKEVATRGITVNCIAPGWIETKMTENLPEKSRDELLKRIPQARTGKPEDIAYTVLFLASDEANYITGQTITVDGGRVIN